jgi:hypothetical protein
MPWRTLYQSCISETNPDRLQKLVFQLEEAIVLRYRHLANQPNAFDELRAIKRAAQRLLQLKIEKLGWLDSSSPEALSKSAAIPASFQIDDPAPVTRRPIQTAWQKLVSRIQVALLAAERAWQSWVFKGLK